MKLDYIIVLNPDKKIHGQFPNFKDGKYLGGATRMAAAITIAKENQFSEIILVGGYNEDNGKDKSTFFQKSQKVEDMKDYLNENKIKNSIVTINSLPCTKHNLIAVFNKYQKKFENKKVGILTNKYHLSRALQFWVKLKEEPDFNKLSIPYPILLAAESSAEEDEKYIRKHEYINRLEEELRGINDILLKTIKDYGDKCIRGDLPKFKRIVKKFPSILLTREEMTRKEITKILK